MFFLAQLCKYLWMGWMYCINFRMAARHLAGDFRNSCHHVTGCRHTGM